MHFSILRKVVAMALCAAVIIGVMDANAWTMKTAALMTQWSMSGTTPLIDSNNVRQEYPRPQMKRPTISWKNLNGIWRFQKTTNLTDPYPAGNLTGDIMVPFPVESAISGVMDYTYQYAWYKKIFQLKAGWDTTNYRIFVRFGASDFTTQVFINGLILAQHTGGYDGFSVDITSRLVNGGTGDQELGVRVYDPTDRISGLNPRGKQVVSPSGIFYSPTTGIWQTVWLEAVPKTAYISSIKITPVVDSQKVRVVVNVAGNVTGLRLYGFAKDQARGTWGGDSVAAAASVTLNISLSALNLWWPNRPYLFNLGLYLKNGSGGAFVDSVQSYFGMRKVAAVRVGSVTYPYINGAAQFLMAPLDQGYWPDGIYSAPSYTAMKFDLVQTKNLGFNCTRKHVKIEPEIWYWACDSMGLMVMQDMPSIGGTPTAAGQTNFQNGLDSMVAQLYNHPSIIAWIVFNEGWGQYNTATLTTRVMTADPTRVVNCATGWTWYAAGHFRDNHAYPGPSTPPVDAAYICGNGEYGGLLVRVTGHEWNPALSFGYGGNNTPAGAITQMTTFMNSFVGWKASQGCMTAIYTEIADQEIECNGFLTYDRISKYTTAQEALITTQYLRPQNAYTPAAIVPPTATIPGSFWVETAVRNDEFTKNTASLNIARIHSENGAITITLGGSDAKGPSVLSILNALGQQVFAATVSRAQTITVPAVAKGVYFIVLKDVAAGQRIRCVVK